MAVRIQFRRGTAAEWAAANPTLAAGELGYETDTAKFKLGNGTDVWDDLVYAGVNQTDIEDAVAAVLDGAPGALDTLNELAAALGDDANFASTIINTITNHASSSTNVHGIANTSLLVTESLLSAQMDNLQNNLTSLLSDHAALTTNVHGIANTALLVSSPEFDVVVGDVSNLQNTVSQLETDVQGLQTDKADLASPSFTGTVVLPTTTSIGDVSDIEISYLNNVSSSIQNQLDDKAPIESPEFIGTVVLPSTTSIGNVSATEISYVDGVTSSIQTQLNSKADIENPEFTGLVVLPTTTSIGDVSAAEISYLNNVTSAIQTQLDGKLDSGVASTTYAPLAGATFTGNVVLTANTTIGTVDSTEISHLNGVTSNIQGQLDDKAPIESPTFTGTVSGITKAMVGLGDVDNTSDLDKPISNATQTALDSKADLSGAVFTGDVETTDLTVTGNLIVQGTTTTISASDLSVKDNMIYLNQAGVSTLTNAVGDGTNVVYTTSEAHGYAVGDDVVITGVTPTSFNIASPGSDIIAVTSNTFTVASTVTDTYTSGGTARGRVHSNPDLGWAAGRYDTVNGSGYAHAGLFRDATDGIFKFFDGYVPEPDESVFIDTNDASFGLADVSVADLYATNVNANAIVFLDGAQTKQGVPSITPISQKTDSYTLSSLTERDTIIEISKSTATTLTIPANASVAYPVGTTLDIIQTGTGQVTIAGADGVTVNATPGLKLRTQWSSATLLKRGENTWLVYGDLTA